MSEQGWQHIWCPNCDKVQPLVRDDMGPDPEAFEAQDLLCGVCKFVIATLHKVTAPGRREEQG